jgi:DNA-binding MarR family transcriptional regulator
MNQARASAPCHIHSIATQEPYRIEDEKMSQDAITATSALHGRIGRGLLSATIAMQRRIEMFMGPTLALEKSELAVLLALDVDTTLTRKAMAAVIGMADTDLAYVIQRLTQLELIFGADGSCGEQLEYFELTPDGQALVEGTRQRAAECESSLAGQLSRAEAAFLVELLQRVAAGLASEVGSDPSAHRRGMPKSPGHHRLSSRADGEAKESAENAWIPVASRPEMCNRPASSLPFDQLVTSPP